MYKYTIARQLATKRVITNRGDEVGKLSDMDIDEKTGDIESLIIDIDKGSKLASKLGLRERSVTIPYSAVTAVSDVFIIDERELAHKD